MSQDTATEDTNSMHYLEAEFWDLARDSADLVDFIKQSCFDGIWYADLEKTENVWLSARYWQAFGYDPATQEHNAEAWQNIVNHDDLESVQKNMMEHFEDKNCPYDQIVRFYHKDGSTVWVRCRGMAVRDETGVPKRMLGIHFDVTSHKEAELDLERQRQELEQAKREIEKREEELNHIFNNVPERILYKDDKNTILRANSAAANSMGFTDAEELRNADSYKLFPEMAAKYHADDLAILDAGEPLRNIIEPYTPKSGASGWVKTDKLPFINDKGERRLLVVISDITELKQREELLVRLNKNLKDFSYVAAHDLQSPLRQVSMLVDILKEDLESAEITLNEDVRSSLEGIDSCINRMRDMVRSLHKLSMLEAKTISLTKIDLAKVAKTALDQIAVDVSESKASITIEPLPEIQGNFGLLVQVFQNLLSNAIKFSGEMKPVVRISYQRDATELAHKILVEDQGPGISAELKDKIFEPFQRLEHNDVEGAGIGLALSRRICDLHHGRIYVDSSYTEGARFVISIPM